MHFLRFLSLPATFEGIYPYSRQIRYRIAIALVVAPTICATPAVAQVVFNPANGHYYERVITPGDVNWSQAFALATARTFAGGTGYLATVTSAAEHSFITANFDLLNVSGNGTYIGGFQPAGSPENAGGWEWVTGEPGPVSPNFTSWSPSEPNGGASENVIEYFPGTTPLWNDIPDNFGRRSFLVEYTPNVATAVTAFTQRPQFPGGFGGVWTSNSDGGTGGFRTFDSFTVPFDTLVTQVTWQAVAIGETSNQAPITTTFQLGFYANASAQPGSSLYQGNVAAAEVARTLVGTTGLGGFPNNYNVYNYTATLPTAFLAAAGTTYWFSPFSLQSAFSPLHSWMPGTGRLTDTISYQDDLVTGQRITRNNDRAFSIRGINAAAAAPEPATFALPLPLMILLLARRKRFHAIAQSHAGE